MNADMTNATATRHAEPDIRVFNGNGNHTLNNQLSVAARETQVARELKHASRTALERIRDQQGAALILVSGKIEDYQALCARVEAESGHALACAATDADRIYAWAHEIDNADQPRRTVTVMHVPPVSRQSWP